MKTISPFVGGGENGKNIMKASGTLQEYKAVGLCLLIPKRHSPTLYYHMQMFAPKHVVTKSCFWYFVSPLKKSSVYNVVVSTIIKQSL